MDTQKTLRGYKDLAKYLNIGSETARKLMLKPDFPVVIVTPHIRLIAVEALEKWLNSQKNRLD